MRPYVLFKLLLTACLTLFPTPFLFSQSMLLPEPTKPMREAAKIEVEKWEDELSLTAKEAMLMERTLLKYALKRNQVMQANLDPQVRLKKLLNLKLLEMGEISNIITKPQYDRYVYLLEQEALQDKFVENREDQIAER